MRSSSVSGIRAFAKQACAGAGIAGAAPALLAAPALADSADTAPGLGDAPVELTGVVVTGERNASEDPRLGEVLDAPQTITIVPQQVIEQRGAASLRDVLRSVTGISMQAGEGGVPAGDQLAIRGF